MVKVSKIIKGEMIKDLKIELKQDCMLVTISEEQNESTVSMVLFRISLNCSQITKRKV